MTTQNTKFNMTIAGLYPIEKGYWSLDIDATNWDALQNVKIGGKFVIKVLAPGSRKTDKTPYAFLEYMTPEQVQTFKSNRKPRDTSQDL